MDLGGALSNYANQMQQGYKDFLENQQRQQKLNFENPREVSLSPQIVNTVMNPAAITYGGALQDVNAINSQNPNFRVIPNPKNPQELMKLFNDGRVEPLKTGGMDQPQESNVAETPQEQERQPAGEAQRQYSPTDASKPGGEQMQAMRVKAAASLGAAYDPQSGLMKFPGHIGMKLLDMYSKALSDQADIYKPHTYAPPPAYTPPPVQHTGRGTKSPDAIAAANAGLKALAGKYGKIGSAVGLGEVLSEQPNVGPSGEQLPSDKQMYQQYQNIITSESVKRSGGVVPQTVNPNRSKAMSAPRQPDEAPGVGTRGIRSGKPMYKTKDGKYKDLP